MSSFFSTAMPIPVRQRSSRKRTSTVLSSYLLTSDSHMTMVAEQNTKKMVEQSKKKQKRTANSSDIPESRKQVRAKSTKSTKTKSKDSTKCHNCGVMFGAKEDNKLSDDWVKCQGCSNWYHESCAETVGIVEETQFTCKMCI